MCGITGLISRTLSPVELDDSVRMMTRTLRHRGPDGAGVKVFHDDQRGIGVALGHRRLAIIDLTSAGHQPMPNEDGTIWLVFNGEIYNFPALRRVLLEHGHRFLSNTDSEVLVHLYEEDGLEFVKRLNGIFAFAILDLNARRVVLARDHLGVKPLFFRTTADGLTFGSELKALLAVGERPDVDWEAISDFFTYLFIPEPRTAFNGIQQIPPAHVATYDLDTGNSTLTRYWKVRRLPELATASVKDVEKELVHRLGVSVEQQKLSDVPLGIFLSGGVDSSVLASLASREGTVPASYTVDFGSPELTYYSEAAVADETSRRLGMKHQRLCVEDVNPLEMLDLVEYFDQPFGNPTYYLQWLIARKAREHITVALSGAGGDELFAGYPRYRAAQLASAFRRIPKGVIRMGQRVLNHARDDYRTMRLRRVREFLDGLDDDPVREFTNWTYFMRSEEKQRLLAGAPVSRGSAEWYLRRFFDDSPLTGGNRLLHVDVQTFLSGNLLEYTDRMSMAVGMEVRVPLLEPDFVEYALNIPFQWKLGRSATKVVFRKAFRDVLTPTVRRGAKRGFNAPLGRWMANELDQYFAVDTPGRDDLGLWSGSDRGVTWRDEGILNRNYIDEMRAEHRRGRQDLSHELFAIIIFDVWWRKYVTGSLPITRWCAHGPE